MPAPLDKFRNLVTGPSHERTPLLPQTTDRPQSFHPQLPSSLAGLDGPRPPASPRTGQHTDGHRLLANASEVEKLFIKHNTQHLKYLDDGHGYRPNPQLMLRTLEKLMRGGARIALESIAGLGLTYAAAITTRTLFGMFAGEDQNGLQSAVIDAIVYLAHTRGKDPLIAERTALGLVTLSVAANYPMGRPGVGDGGNQGAQYAVAAMSAARLTKAAEAIFGLLKNMRPTRREDIQAVFAEFYRHNEKTISQMPEDRRQSYDQVAEEVKQYWTAEGVGSNISNDQLTHCRNLMETLEILVKSFENSRHIPKNNWHYDVGDVRAAKELNQRIARLCEGVDDAGKKAVEKFATNHLMLRSANWAPMEGNKDGSNMNVLVLAGDPDSAKFVSKALCTELESEEVTVMFSDVLRHLGGDEKQDTSSEKIDPSPARQFGTFREVLCIKPGSIVRMEDVSLIGKAHASAKEDANSEPIDYDYLKSTKMKWETNGSHGLFTVKGHPEGVLLIADLRRVSFIMTTSNIPNDPTLNQRMGVAYCDKMPEPKRREIAYELAQYCFSDLIPHYYGESLTPQQIDAIKADVARMMEFIVAEGAKDPGPQTMRMVIIGLTHDLARQYALGERTADVADLESESALDVKEKNLIMDHFKANRGLDRVDNPLQKAKREVAELKESENEAKDIQPRQIRRASSADTVAPPQEHSGTANDPRLTDALHTLRSMSPEEFNAVLVKVMQITSKVKTRGDESTND